MREPKIHSRITQMLTDDEAALLRPFANPHDNSLHCIQCGYPVYNFERGTVMTWVETGRRHEHESPELANEIEAGIWDLWCFTHKELSVFPVMGPEYGFHDDGSPLSVEESDAMV